MSELLVSGCIPERFETSPATWQRLLQSTDRAFLLPPRRVGGKSIALVLALYGIEIEITALAGRKDGAIALVRADSDLDDRTGKELAAAVLSPLRPVTPPTCDGCGRLFGAGWLDDDQDVLFGLRLTDRSRRAPLKKRGWIFGLDPRRGTCITSHNFDGCRQESEARPNVGGQRPWPMGER